jgi:hypothetical protein
MSHQPRRSRVTLNSNLHAALRSTARRTKIPQESFIDVAVGNALRACREFAQPKPLIRVPILTMDEVCNLRDAGDVARIVAEQPDRRYVMVDLSESGRDS